MVVGRGEGGHRSPVRPQAGVTLVMILHELATNAAKYGALSVPTGTVSITWATDDRDGQSQIQLDWIETGGPPVEPPSRRGFGSTLIERGTDNDLHGRAVLDYRSEGLRCTLRFPWEEARPRDTGGNEPWIRDATRSEA